MTSRSSLADFLDEVSSQLIAGVEQALSPTAVALPLRRTIERLPGLMRDLVDRLRAARSDEPSEMAIPLVELDIAPLVTALRMIKKSLHALINERQGGSRRAI
jgi:hypothetical protein